MKYVLYHAMLHGVQVTRAIAALLVKNLQTFWPLDHNLTHTHQRPNYPVIPRSAVLAGLVDPWASIQQPVAVLVLVADPLA
jgi:hypothetical protein